MLEMTESGLHCAAGDFYIDPTRKVEKAVITHAHADHARRGMTSYLTHTNNEALLRYRLHKGISVQTLPYGKPITIGDATVSLHPSAHMLGASQVRVEVGGQVWVVTGDYKREADPLAGSFEVVPCHTLITECTFGLPVYRWFDPSVVSNDVNAWWQRNANNGVISVIKAYSLGKAQRILLNLDTAIGPVYANQSVYDANNVIRASGHFLPPTELLTRSVVKESFGQGALALRQSLVISAGSVSGVLAGVPYAEAYASGWTLIKRFRQTQPGFTISDHADWDGLLRTVRETGCERVLAVHGFTEPFTRYLREQGLDASVLEPGAGRTEVTSHETSNWLTDACIQHVGSATEVEALLHGLPYKSLHSALNYPSSLTSEASYSPSATTDELVIRCVLLHLHRSPGSQAIERLTVGVWKDNAIVPLAHVGIDISTPLLIEIQAWAATNTTTEVGPVRTIAPHFVFDVVVRGIRLAQRRKCGLKVETAFIQGFVGYDPASASTAEQLMAHVEQ